MADEKMTPTLNFGQFIAFVAPGAIVLAALGTRSRLINELFHTSAGGPTAIGAFLLIVLASLTLGLAVSGIRDTLHWLLDGGLRLLVKEKPFAWGAMTAEKASVILLFHEHFYRFYQFNSSTAIACLAGALIYESHPNRGLPGGLWAVAIALIVVLAAAAVRNYWSYSEAVRAKLAA